MNDSHHASQTDAPWWRDLFNNPIYLREKGEWGTPNPFYDKLSRYSPFVVLAALVLGLCSGYSPGMLMATGDEFAGLWCLVCLPGILVTMLTWVGVVMAPAVTAPSISLEVQQGTWDVLRLTPQSTTTILMAKLFGGLARLRIWPFLLGLSVLQAVVFAGGGLLIGNMMMAGLLGLASLIRPWLEILFAGLLGMVLSTRLRSATLALAATYGCIILFKVMSGTLTWMLGLFSANFAFDFLAISMGPVLLYFLATAGLFLALTGRADKIGYVRNR